MVQKADQLIETLYATYSSTGKINPKDQWYSCPISPQELEYLRDREKSGSQYDSVVNRLRMEYTKFEEYQLRLLILCNV